MPHYLVQAAYTELVKAGFPHEQAVQVVSHPGGPGVVLEQVTGHSQPDIARAALAVAAERLGRSTRGDESAVLAKYAQSASGPQRGTSRADSSKGDETAVLRKYFPYL